MAILRSNGVMLVDTIPTHTPTGNGATLAQLENTTTFYYWDATLATPAWVPVDFAGGGGIDTSLYLGDGSTGSTLRTVTNEGDIAFVDPTTPLTDYTLFNSNKASFIITPTGQRLRQGIKFESSVGAATELYVGAKGSGESLVESSGELFLTSLYGKIHLGDLGNTFEDVLAGKKGLQLVGFGENNLDDSLSTADYSTLTKTSLVPKRYADAGNMFLSDGTITSGELRKITLGDGGIEFIDPNRPNNNITIFNDYDNPKTNVAGDDITMGIEFNDPTEESAKIGFYLFEDNLSIDYDSSVTFTDSTGASSTLIGLASFDVNNLGAQFSLSSIGHSFRDLTAPKQGIQLLGFGEIDTVDSTETADYSTLVNTSLVPKRYVDDLIGNAIKLHEADYKTGTGAPGAAIPDYIGQDYLDTAAEQWYKATSLTTWKQTTI